MRQAFIVIVDYDDPVNAPVIGDIAWSIRDAIERWGTDWQINVTDSYPSVTDAGAESVTPLSHALEHDNEPEHTRFQP